MEDIINSYLTFKVGQNIFGVHVDNVVEIIEYVAPKSKPNNLPYLSGFVEHRDDVIPLIDTGLKFGLDAIEVTPQTCIVVLAIRSADQPDFHVALAVDYVSDVIEINPEDKQTLDSKYKPGYVSFAVKYNDALALIINADKIFADTDVVMLSKLMGN